VSIRIQIVTSPGPISAAIRFETRCWASHVEFVEMVDGHTLGSRSKGGVMLRKGSLDRYSKVEQFTANGINEAYEWALMQVGKPYDYSAIAGITLNRNWRNESRWFCSELVAAAFEHAGCPILSTRPSIGIWRITPRDILLSRQIYFLAAGGTGGAGS
jgi:uncharacterized protein YycO